MRIKKLTLFSADLESQKLFYRDTLGFDLLNETSESFSISMGWSILSFKKSKEKFLYHYCFLIPSNKLDEGFEWFKNRVDIVSFEGNTKFDFESWNAKSFYFLDGSGNIAECIVRYDLDNPSLSKFSISDLLCVNEIGSPTNQIQKFNESLEMSIGSTFWKGDLSRFGTNGNNEGLFLLVNPEIKKVWYPTNTLTQSSPFEASIETNKGIFEISYSGQDILVIQKVLVP